MTTVMTALLMFSIFLSTHRPVERFITKRWLKNRLVPAPQGSQHAFAANAHKRLSVTDLIGQLDQGARAIQSGESAIIVRQRIESNLYDFTDVYEQRLVKSSLSALSFAGPAASNVLSNLADVLRRNCAIRELRNAQASTALLSAKVLTFLPIVAGGFMALIDPRVRRFIFHSTGGLICLLLAATLNYVASKWMRRLVQPPTKTDPLPIVVDFITIGLVATGTTSDAIRWAHKQSGATQLEKSTLALSQGAPLSQCLDALQEALGPSAAPLVAALRAHHRDGLPVAPTLDRIRAFITQSQQHQSEASARQLPVKLSFPLVFLTLPSFALVTVVPLIASALQSLHTSTM